MRRLKNRHLAFFQLDINKCNKKMPLRHRNTNRISSSAESYKIIDEIFKEKYDLKPMKKYICSLLQSKLRQTCKQCATCQKCFRHQDVIQLYVMLNVESFLRIVFLCLDCEVEVPIDSMYYFNDDCYCTHEISIAMKEDTLRQRLLESISKRRKISNFSTYILQRQFGAK